MATEPVEMQVRVEYDDPGLNTRGSVMLGRAVEEHSQLILLKQLERVCFETRICHRYVLFIPSQSLTLIFKERIKGGHIIEHCQTEAVATSTVSNFYCSKH